MRISDPLAKVRTDPLLARWAPFVAVVDDVLGPDECAALVARIEAEGPTAARINRGSYQELAPTIRDNDRAIFDDVPLARELFARLAPAVPPAWGGATAVGLNERFRGYRYAPGQRFAPHFDGCLARGRERSEITVLLYLNDVRAGGETAFLDWDLRVAPRRGMALLFQHHVHHEGRPVERGWKYVLRSDVMYHSAT